MPRQRAGPSARVIALLVGVLCALPLPARARGLGCPQPSRAQRTSTLTVPGHGAIRATPDEASVTLGVVAEGRSAELAAGQGNVRMQAMMSSLARAGVPRSEIRTEGLFLDFYVPAGRPSTRVYRWSDTVEVTLLDVSRVGPVLDAAVAAGANQVGGVTFDVQHRDRLVRQALALAVADARDKARAMARALGMELGPVVSAQATEQPPFFPRPYMAMAAAAPSSTTVQPGRIEIQADVTVIYSLR